MKVLQLTAILIIQLISVLIFCIGFFPSKNVLEGDAVFEISSDAQLNAKPAFNKLVLVVIDALRSDFLFDQDISQFNYIHELSNNGYAWGFTAFSNPPTVTLPRLKGITTGSTPNFLDAILNVAEDDSSSNLKNQDSWPMQFAKHGKKIRFFGDDTWLKLFPHEIFTEYEGTNSFFVSDFEQVDHNVTRHLEKQIKEKNDWDALILHYLGLDHIGHKGGPTSKFMGPKHREMDSIIKNLFETVGQDENTLICVMGDHGMNEVGNHGGSSPGETSAGLVLISKKLKNFEVPSDQKGVKLPIKSVNVAPEEDKQYKFLTQIQQVDIVPTLSALFNIPFPKNNVGVMMPSILELLDPKLFRIKLQENFRQLMIVSNNKDIRQLYESYDFENTEIKDIISEMKDIQGELTSSATNYNVPLLYLGLGLIFILTLTISFWFYFSVLEVDFKNVLIVIISLLIGLSSFASSFVEEEHQIWWWIITGLITVSAINLPDQKIAHLVMFVCVRIIRGWNNSGQKYSYDRTISILLNTEYEDFQWYLNIATILYIMLKDSTDNLISFMFSYNLGSVCILYKVCWTIINQDHVPEPIYKAAIYICRRLSRDYSLQDISVVEENLIPIARFFFYSVLAIVIAIYGSAKLKLIKNPIKDIQKTLTFLLIFQSPSSYIGLFMVYDILQSSLSSLLVNQYSSNVMITSTISLVLQYFTFFQFGGTNSIATADLTNAYNGVSEDYNIYFVGFLMCVSNFAPAIYWAMFPWKVIYNQIKPNNKWNVFAENKLPIVYFNCIAGCFLLLSCFILRYHLFIWSVFSPKLCYYATWNIFMNLIVGWVLEIAVLSMVDK
ncbi:hypothetical protein Kpol_1035p26 [Vanderwaltozyma polyspora DSM 70294]|uniref:GPI ethanolamine phosphate transferase 2 n=1 Tax=Vanderwaltozyma polyspora (strain ATCC 22028 / DSM 70294 / BCRC 21397 / CBS 2163 / NBRC 10782 / NRRL Y-8283 / UCD 57-17) TaxID=436907 RepID=A7TKJ1_VANPO|nr:uncharacterized protein Kpol_1035p26 [Vanderwaltozyma polyspora DSM 70294]EDO17213.1 hypothetical protein Kpol_1035p26 [Vanderwaltozyma polyspora DSM 70294]